MSRWFRFYSDAMRNPKVGRLNDAQFRLWVELMSVAADNDGSIPGIEDLKHVLKRRLDHLSRGLDDLIKASLIDPLTDGYEPHNWSKHQYKSDSSTDRVTKHRAKRNVSETPPEADTDTDTDTDKTEANASGDASPIMTAADITKSVWDTGKAILKASGHDDRQAGSIIGRFRKTYSDSQVLIVLARCQVVQPSEPIEWLTIALQSEANRNDNGNRNSTNRNGHGQNSDRRSGLATAIDDGIAHIDAELARVRGAA